MRNSLDFSSWQGLVSTLLGLILVSVIAVGVRLLVMQSVQQRRERQNRQINERLKTLIAAYKVLGGSFTGDLAVDPSHLRALRQRAGAALPSGATATDDAGGGIEVDLPVSDRRRRIRDAVEAALSDIILLGTETQVRLAAKAATDMVEGRTVETAELVISLRSFIRDVLDLDPIEAQVRIPKQGPVRAKGAAERGGGAGGAAKAGGRGGGGGGAGAGAAGGMGAGFGMGAAMPHGAPDDGAPEEAAAPR